MVGQRIHAPTHRATTAEDFVPNRPAAPTRRELSMPTSWLVQAVGSWQEPALLESGPGFGAGGRWSILAARPRLVFLAGPDRGATNRPGGLVSTHSGPLWEPLAALLSEYQLADPSETPDPELPPFQGGLIGFFSYDLAPQVERLPRRAPRDSAFPVARFALYDTFVTIDNARGAADLWAFDLLGEGKAALDHRVRRWQADLESTPPTTPARSRLGPLSPDVAEGAYIHSVRRALEYIAAGDVFQVNLSQRFSARGQPDPLDLYLRLRDRSPAPFACFLSWDDLAVVGASPEWFYQTRGDRIVTRPIKGTRPRGRSFEEDARLAAELAASPKDRAELTMIVDLERNDLGRVCRYGTVKVVDPLTVEMFAQVHHLVATVEGRLWPHVGPLDVVKAVFPGGSITGAPKIRAMEIIDELEPTRRGLYTGAIGYFSRGAASAFNIVIRTLLVEGDRVSFQVGGGIVADSDPAAEYHETLHKGRGLREVLEESGG
jgi:para-aminobenzoate synthetase component I